MSDQPSNSAAAELRSAAKWLLAAVFGALGLIIGLLPASEISAKTFSISATLIVIAAGVVVLAGAALLTWAGSAVLRARPTTLRSVISRIDSTPQSATSTRLLRRLRDNRASLLRGHFADVRDLLSCQQAISTADDARRAQIIEAEERVLQYVDEYSTDRAYQRLMWLSAITGPAMIVSIAVAFATILSLPLRPRLIPLDNPLAVTVDWPQHLIEDPARADCLTDPHSSAQLIALADNASTYLVSIPASATCTAQVHQLDAAQNGYWHDQ